jgi:transcriptional regulatory protein LevR
MKEHQALYNIIKQGLRPLEEKYNVSISDDELCYMMNFFEYYEAIQ